MKSYWVSALGVTLECQADQSMLDWLEFIVNKGGVPVIEPIR